jgi:hypothetical protein
MLCVFWRDEQDRPHILTAHAKLAGGVPEILRCLPRARHAKVEFFQKEVCMIPGPYFAVRENNHRPRLAEGSIGMVSPRVQAQNTELLWPMFLLHVVYYRLHWYWRTIDQTHRRETSLSVYARSRVCLPAYKGDPPYLTHPCLPSTRSRV